MTDAAASPDLKVGGDTVLSPLDAERAGAFLRDLGAAAVQAELPRLAAFAASTAPNAARLAAVLDLSSYLRGLMLGHPEWLDALFEETAKARIEARVAELRALPEENETEKSLMRRLRLAKNEVALLLALRDLFGEAAPVETTRLLSELAEEAVRAALRFCLCDLARTNKIDLPDPAKPEEGCGLFVLGMGKLGGHELNYSSDIDLIVFFEPDAGIVREREEDVEILSRLARRLVRILGERTVDGYVFRTDLRLRPDPGAMPLAISVPTALVYYESSGRNWERAAMIKARPIAGDIAAGERFLDEIAPFVWRKYLDFAAIADIRAMKHRIDTHRGFDEVALAGHNVKLGRGGIREVEFFVQAQQLIAGGRLPELRSRRTDEALAALARAGWIEPAARDAIEADYWFLRRVEHAVQMVADEQTHTLPETEEGLTRIARLLGHAELASFRFELLACLGRVDERFAELFHEGQERGDEVDEEALAAKLFAFEGEEAPAELAAMGFARPLDVARIVRGWSFGRYRATRTQTARERLARILPQLLEAFSRARDPDGAVAGFDKFLAGLPEGIQFFSLIASNPRILDLLATVITSAPALAETLGNRPHVFDALLDPAFYAELPDPTLMEARLAAFLGEADGFEDLLARLRIFASEQRFLIGARLLGGTLDGDAAGKALAKLADIVLAAALDAVCGAFAERHGQVPGARLALLGMGKLGSGELTARSDVDLILLYEHDPEADASDGEKPLAPTLYFSRLTQRLIAALTVPMREGVLYEVDFRLRPSGNKGPLATEFGAFAKYQRGEAWTWEHMALTRARPIAGSPELRDAAEAEIRAILAERRGDRDRIASDVAAMRRRLERDKPAKGPLDLKMRPGGLVDLEFLAQWALLTGRADLALTGHPTAEILAAADLGSDEARSGLSQAMTVLTGAMQLLRLGPESAHGLETLPSGLAARIATALGAEGIDGIEPALNRLTGEVRRCFGELLPQFEDETEA